MKSIIGPLNILLFTALTFSFLSVDAQQQLHVDLSWESPIEYGLQGSNLKNKALSFEGAEYLISDETHLPVFYREVGENVSAYLKSANIKNAKFERVSLEEGDILNAYNLKDEIEVELVNSIISKRKTAFVRIIPIRKFQGQYEKLVSFDLELEYQKLKAANEKSLTFATESKMKDGEWYKIAVTKHAIFKLDYNFLSQLGIEMENLDPRNIKLYGYGGGMLPELNSEERPDDLMENAITIVGEQDGKFDLGDYIVFYGEQQIDWEYYENLKMFRHQLNYYSDTTYYFLNIEGTPGKRVSKAATPTTAPSLIVDSYDDYGFYEQDNVNLLKSGRMWLGELFDNNLTYTFGFDFTDVIETDTARFEVFFAARSPASSSFKTLVNDQEFTTTMGIVNLTRYESTFAQVARGFYEFFPQKGTEFFTMTYNKPVASSRGWLNFLTVNARRELNLREGQSFFRDIKSINLNINETAEFKINSASRDIKVWELTDKYNIRELEVIDNGASKSIISSTEVLKEFVAFDEYNSTDVYPRGRINNQNLHAQPQADLVIISHPRFLGQAERLASFHRQDGLSVNVATTEQVYNEFSSGSQDLVAIRTYIKMFYDRSTNEEDRVKYAMLIGDASYDYKDKINGNTNFLPAYQAPNSIDPIESYVSDDFFGFLDDDEGEWRAGGADRMDIGLGRLPVKTEKEAEGVVNKIINYYSRNSFEDWRNEMVFVGDDEDGRIHMSQSNTLSLILNGEDKSFNQKKIFLDAYAQQSTANGDRYPQATKELNESITNGALVVNYTGHGGETGWTSERVLGVSDIVSWENSNSLPLFLTATCEFSRFDDPLRTSGGEMVLLNSKGGGIGLFTTTRLVYSRPNFQLNATFYQRAFKREADGSTKRLGDIFKEVKNAHGNDPNSRNFTFLGDPALRFAIPQYQVVTTSINGKALTEIDTLRALSKATIVGKVLDKNGNDINNYNGLIDVSVFDKIESKSTLNNDGDGTFTFTERSSKLFKGKASVKNGNFEFSFVVPKDISYSFGSGKISYYTTDQTVDGNGYTENFTIGGSNPNAISDKEGPEMELFMNDKSFIFGGITNKSPVLIVDLADEQGINTVGSGIGHDLVAILDENTQDAFILNDYYEAAVDDYSKGTINFPFSELSEGKHTLRVKAWDVANNSSEKTIEFTVTEDKEVEIDNLVNYPNPFTTNTEFIFQHNQAGVPMDVKLEIFTVSGKLLKSFNEVVVNDGFISRDIRWNGRDDFGDKIGKGVYVYKIKVRSRNGSSTEKFEKLVIL